MASTFTDRDRGYAAVLGGLAELRGAGVRVGFFAGDAREQGEADHATIAAVHEFGVTMTVTPAQSAFMARELGMARDPGDTLTIPARPVVLSAFDQDGPAMADKAAREAAAGLEKGGAFRVLSRLGLAGEARWRRAYVDARNTVEPLSPVTIEQRRKRSVGSDSPLVDTGQMVNAVRHLVE